MKICITAKGPNLDSAVELRFGRSPYFIMYDTEIADFEAIANPNIGETSGVGIKAGQLMIDEKVVIILTGQIGPKASNILEIAGIKIITIGANFTTAKEVIEKYQAGELSGKDNKIDDQLIGVQQDAKVATEMQMQPTGWFGRYCKRIFGGNFGRGQERDMSRNNNGFGQGFGQGRGMNRGCGRGRSRRK